MTSLSSRRAFVAAAMAGVAALTMFTVAVVAQEKEPIVIGTSNQLSGHTATVGRPFVAGANTYINWINDQGGINGRKIRFIALDDQGNPDTGIANLRQLLSENALVIFQPVSSAVAAPMLPILAENNAIMVSYTGVEAMYGNPNYFAIGLDTTTTLGIVANYITSVVGDKKPRVSFLNVETPASIGARDAVIEKIKALGWEVGELQTYPPKVTDFSPQIAKLAASNPDYIVGTVVDGFLPQVVMGMRRAGIKAPLVNFQAGNAESSFKTLATDQFLAVRDFLDPVEKDPAMDQVREIADKYGSTGEMTSNTFTKGWVTAAVTVAALKKCEPDCDQAKLKAALLTTDYDTGGLGPRITFSETQRVGAQSGRLYKWDAAKDAAVPATDFIEALK
ncbi:MAG: ABC transporter substrate-binding protein [Mesorhizobium sp.]|nr:ABC transporter substrate-binding protein [Mesorhizobium sp.]MCO5164098.1 ABC transporter substrate-binding protein [Mesorhizobium sp.]